MGPLLHGFGIVVAVLGTRHKYREVEPMQQFVDAREGVLHAEFGFEDGDTVAASQRADAVGLDRSSQYTPLERLVPLGRQAGRATRRGLDGYRLKPALAVDVAPALNEAA
mgnify:CR=1 FL=1